MAYGSLAYGLLTGTFHADMMFDETDWRVEARHAGRAQPVPHHVRPRSFPRATCAAVEELKALAAKYGKTLPQFALRWTLSQPADRTPGWSASAARPRWRKTSARSAGTISAGGHGRDRRDLRPSTTPSPSRRAGWRTIRQPEAVASIEEEAPCRFNASRR